MFGLGCAESKTVPLNDTEKGINRKYRHQVDGKPAFQVGQSNFPVVVNLQHTLFSGRDRNEEVEDQVDQEDKVDEVEARAPARCVGEVEGHHERYAAAHNDEEERDEEFPAYFELVVLIYQALSHPLSRAC